MNGSSDSPPPPPSPPPPSPPQPPPPPPQPSPPPRQISGGDHVGKEEKHLKKRPKTIRIGDLTPSGSASNPKSKSSKRKHEFDPNKVTRPCTECGKTFCSWKALFGHMRCHPEREWRGINPPPRYRRDVSPEEQEPGNRPVNDGITENDHEVAASLLMLAFNDMNDPLLQQYTRNEGAPDAADSSVVGESSQSRELVLFRGQSSTTSADLAPRYQCSTCKRVFGSHQALGGHRASHKTVKGCFANTAHTDGSSGGENTSGNNRNSSDARGKSTVVDEESMVSPKPLLQCEVCKKLFLNAQALGGHRRTHQERRPPLLLQEAECSTSRRVAFEIDLNKPPPEEDETDSSSSTSSSSSDSLDLKLGF